MYFPYSEQRLDMLSYSIKEPARHIEGYVGSRLEIQGGLTEEELDEVRFLMDIMFQACPYKNHMVSLYAQNHLVKPIETMEQKPLSATLLDATVMVEIEGFRLCTFPSPAGDKIQTGLAADSYAQINMDEELIDARVLTPLLDAIVIPIIPSLN